ncbi:MAG: hypothetical protein WAV32_10100 [Halobacteriota archaeon]
MPLAKKENQENLEAEWIERAAREIADTLKNLRVNEIVEIIDFYEASINDPASMHMPLEPPEEGRIKRLAGKNQLKSIILLKTRALIFSPSILAPASGSLDYGTAMHRKFFINGLWFSIISLNEAYIESATEPMLRYMLEHELAQGKIYKELVAHSIKRLDSYMKRIVHEEAKVKAIRRSTISADDLERERLLILDLASKHPLVPPHFASVSLYKYLEAHWEDVKQFGLESQGEIEEELATANVAARMQSSRNSFEAFLKALKRELTMTGAEYGIEIV